MLVLQSILGVLAFAAIILLPMAAVFYASGAFGWGFRRFPKSTTAIAIVLVTAVILAGATFHRLFPRCDVQLSGIVLCLHQ
jgi:hypothetical protein